MGDLPAFDDIDPRYRAVYERAVDVFSADHRVHEVVLRGSVASGTADAWSDLDLAVVTTEDGYDGFVGDWRVWLAAITPTVFAEAPLAPSLVNAVTADGLAFDVAIHRGSLFEFPVRAGWAVGPLNFSTIDEALTAAVAELLRGLCGPFISLVQRGEHLRHVVLGVPHLLGLLTTVFLAELDAPAPTKAWSEVYTAEQLGAVAALPPVVADRESIVAFGLAVAELAITRARREFVRRNLEWPHEFAQVSAARVRDQLGIELDWLY